MHMIAVPSAGVSHNLNYDDNNVTSSTTVQIDNSSLPCTSAIADAEEGLCDKWPVSQKTTSAPDAFPSRLVDKRSNVQILTAEDRDTWAMTQKMCPKCENAELKYRDFQTRGADEGSTIFYKCPACDHGFKEDN
ncbi:hypothetical protein KCU77_g9097, partial [Aureobasidium melanogenum]